MRTWKMQWLMSDEVDAEDVVRAGQTDAAIPQGSSQFRDPASLFKKGA